MTTIANFGSGFFSSSRGVSWIFDAAQKAAECVSYLPAAEKTHQRAKRVEQIASVAGAALAIPDLVSGVFQVGKRALSIESAPDKEKVVHKVLLDGTGVVETGCNALRMLHETNIVDVAEKLPVIGAIGSIAGGVGEIATLGREIAKTQKVQLSSQRKNLAALRIAKAVNALAIIILGAIALVKGAIVLPALVLALSCSLLVLRLSSEFYKRLHK